MRYLIALDPTVYASQEAGQQAIEAAGATVVSAFNFNLTFEIDATEVQHDAIVGVTLSELASTPVTANLQVVNTDHLTKTMIRTQVGVAPTWNPAYTGAGQHVYLIDTGIKATHEQFASATINNLYSNFDGTGAVSQFGDEAGHGTATGSLIVGNTLGSAPAATLHNVKLFEANTGQTTIGEIINALNAVLTHHANTPSHAKVVCMPWIIDKNTFVDAKISEMNGLNLVVVCSAGNTGADVNDYSPAGVNSVITVGAFDRSYVVSSFTATPWVGAAEAGFNNYGAELDIFALGVDVSVASNDANDAYNTASGTSLSASITAGIATHYIARAPSATASKIKESLISEGKASGGNITFDNSNPNIDYSAINKSVVTTDTAGAAQLAALQSGRILNVQVGTTANVNLQLLEDVSNVEVLSFAPTPEWIVLDTTSGIVTADATEVDPTLAPGIYVFAVKGNVGNDVLVEEYSVGLYTTSESDLEEASSFYYDVDTGEYDKIVNYQVAPFYSPGGLPKP
jgi:subtilisin family serine protease